MEAKENKCKHFVARKKRFCKMTVKSGQEYCGEHQKISDKTSPDGNQLGLRIVCPLDRKHTCYAHNLKKHLKICNARLKTVEAYIVKDFNYKDNPNDPDDDFKLLNEFNTNEIKETIKKVDNVYKNLIEGQITEKLTEFKLIEEEMSKPEFGDKTKKHLKQASSILGLLKENNLMQPSSLYIEFGAGRGQLSYWLALATETDDNSKIIIIEKSSPKHKKDNKISRNSDKIKRIRADIADLVLDKLDTVGEINHIVGVTKHLCGAATDLALRCLVNTKQCNDKVKGGVFTFCCHHRCRWVSYTGKLFFQENSFNVDDFIIMCGMASWATCGTGLSRTEKHINVDNLRQNERDIEIGLSRSEKEEVGRRSKIILNWGRLKYMEQQGFSCKLHYYVNTSISLENVCIVFVK